MGSKTYHREAQPVKMLGGTDAMGMGHVARVSTVVPVYNTCFFA